MQLSLVRAALIGVTLACYCANSPIFRARVFECKNKNSEGEIT
jgi:hypothetical protein